VIDGIAKYNKVAWPALVAAVLGLLQVFESVDNWVDINITDAEAFWKWLMAIGMIGAGVLAPKNKE